jgi:hypothetical protein
VADPLWINASGGAPAYSAQELRQATALGVMYDGRATGGRQGVRPGGTQLEVTLVGSTITVAVGVAYVDPDIISYQGGYWVALGASETPGPLQAADATNPRKDIVILRVYDDDIDSSGLRLARSEYLVGTPNPSPVEPTVPAGAIRLATIDVPAVGGGAASVTDRRAWTVAPGGILPLDSQTERDSLPMHAGLTVYRMDRDWVEVCTGAAWRVQGVPLCTSVPDLAAITSPATGQVAVVAGSPARLYQYTGSGWVTSPVVTSGTWTPVSSWSLTGTWSGTWQRLGDMMVVRAQITLTAAAAAWPTNDNFSITGLPTSAVMLVGANCYINWGNRPSPADVDSSTIWVSLVNKTGSLPSSGSVVRVSAAYMVA